jgi:hypothetical protein
VDPSHVAAFGIPPRTLPSKASQERPASYETEVAKLKWGFVVFNPPLRMTVATTERIETRIARSIAPDLYKGLKGRGELQTEEAKVGPHMTATLVGANFDILQLNSAEQYVPLAAYTQWAWNVTPRRRGVQTLALRVTVRLRLPDHPDEVVDESVLEKLISVRVNALHSANYFVRTQWKWIVGTILSAVVAAVLGELLIHPPHK